MKKRALIFAICVALSTPTVSARTDKEPDVYIVSQMIKPDITDGYIEGHSLRAICKVVGEEYDISPELLQAIVQIESGGKVVPRQHSSYKGLCQICTKYCKSQMKRLGITDPSDPYSNIRLAADILDEYRDKNGMTYALMAYNMGPGGANKYHKRGKVSSYARTAYRLEKKFKEENKCIKSYISSEDSLSALGSATLQSRKKRKQGRTKK